MSWRGARTADDRDDRGKSEPGKILVSKSAPLIRARIRGLDSIEECREWIEYELEHEPEGKPRKWVVSACNERIADLEEKREE